MPASAAHQPVSDRNYTPVVPDLAAAKARLVAAWAAWDELSGDDGRATAMENAVNAVASLLGTPPTLLRQSISDGIRHGHSREQVVRAL